MTANIGASVDSDPSISPLSAGCMRLSRNDWLSVVAGGISARVIVLIFRSFRGCFSCVQPAGPQGDPASHSRVIRAGPGAASGGRRLAGETADLDEFQPERLDLGQYSVQCGLVRQVAGEQRVLALCLRAQGGERGAYRPAQPAPDADLVAHRAVHAVSPGEAMRAMESRHRTASRTEKLTTAGKVPANSDSTPTPITGMIRPA